MICKRNRFVGFEREGKGKKKRMENEKMRKRGFKISITGS